MAPEPGTTPDNSPPQIVGLGLAIVDFVHRVKSMPRWDAPGGLTGFVMADGGPAGTACVVASILGAKTGFIDTVADDALGQHRVSALKVAEVDTSRMVARDGSENHLAIVYVKEKDGDRTFSFLPEFLANPVLPEEVDLEYVTSAQYLHLDCFHPEASLVAAKAMRAAGKTVVVDAAATNRAVSEIVRSIVAETDVLIAGSGFCNMLTGAEDLSEAGWAASELGPDVVVQTLGEKGSHTVSRGQSTGKSRGSKQEFQTPAFKVDVVDTTGAGDVFHGAYLFGLLQGWKLERIAVFASAVSAMHCTVLGNRKGIPTLEEVERFLEAQKVQGL